MKKRFFSLIIKRLMLAFLLIIQAGTFPLHSTASNFSTRAVSCAPNEDSVIIYNKNSVLDLDFPNQSCTIIVVGDHTHLTVRNADQALLLAMPSDTDSGWLHLQKKYPLNIYYSGVYRIDVQGKLQQMTLQLPTLNSKVIYENASHRAYRRLRSAEQLFAPLEFQTATVALLSGESS
ncbi:MAG: hypothetical protein RIT27_2203 [Pseudomonadota bacterium]|jgi:hypothetical protein